MTCLFLPHPLLLLSNFSLELATLAGCLDREVLSIRTRVLQIFLEAHWEWWKPLTSTFKQLDSHTLKPRSITVSSLKGNLRYFWVFGLRCPSITHVIELMICFTSALPQVVEPFAGHKRTVDEDHELLIGQLQLDRFFSLCSPTPQNCLMGLNLSKSLDFNY